MLNLKKPIELSDSQKAIIKSFGALKVECWKKNETKLRKQIYKDLCKLQHDLCVYCGCKVYQCGDVEHIAPKAAYTEFMFTPKNLAYSCKACNQNFKAQVDVIKIKNSDYEKCEFTIVHPYLDNVDDFFDTSTSLIKIRPSLNSAQREKALRTHQLLKWHSSAVIQKRAVFFLALQKAKELDKSISQIADENTLRNNIENILTYIP